MKHFILFLMIFSSTAQASVDCLNGFWDMGPQAAVVGFECETYNGALSEDEARLFFCNRRILLEQGRCTAMDSISCRWQEGTKIWSCDQQQGETFRFHADIQRLSTNQIHYKAKSNFADIELIGTLIQAQ